MTGELNLDSHSGAIMLICLFYGLHMVEEFSFGFVPWADRYFGRFDWTQNLVGNFLFLVCLAAACYLYYENPTSHLWAGMSAAMWILANAFLHISCTILGREYSPGVVTAVVPVHPRWGIFSLAMGQTRFTDLGKFEPIIPRGRHDFHAHPDVCESGALSCPTGKDFSFGQVNDS